MELARLIIDPPADGPWNMAVDQALLETAAATGLITLRFYGWSEPTLSLGYFQKHSDRQQHLPSSKCPLVRRQTGGGAILHHHELTYSLSVPSQNRWSQRNGDLYRWVHQLIIEILNERSADPNPIEANQQPVMADPSRELQAELYGDLNPVAGDREDNPRDNPASDSPAPDSGAPDSAASGDPILAGNAPFNRHPSANDRQPPPEIDNRSFLCFQRRADGDVVLGGYKVVGSAQRRLKDSLIQHGSVLLARSKFTPELWGIRELSRREWRGEQIAKKLKLALEKRLQIELKDGMLSPAEILSSKTWHSQRFNTREWNFRR